MKTFFLSLLLFLFFINSLFAQTCEIEVMWKDQIDTGHTNLRKPRYLEIRDDKIFDLINRQLSFGIYHDNYFTTGIPTNKEVNCIKPPLRNVY